MFDVQRDITIYNTKFIQEKMFIFLHTHILKLNESYTFCLKYIANYHLARSRFFNFQMPRHSFAFVRLNSAFGGLLHLGIVYFL